MSADIDGHDDEQIAYYNVKAQALVEAVIQYEDEHPKGGVCFAEALTVMRQVCEP